MFKKLMLTAFVIAGLAMYAKAAEIDQFVRVSTGNLALSASVIKGPAELIGVTFSTGAQTDYIVFSNTGTLANIRSAGDVFRVYNLGQTTGTYSQLDPAVTVARIGYQKVDPPIYFDKGIGWYGMFTSSYNFIAIHYRGNRY